MKFPHDGNRLQAFSDGVFAFAATLMVVTFDLSGDFQVLLTQGISFISCAVSFFVLVGLWWVHYNYFRRSGYVDNWIIFFNTILLFVILYYVFPLKSLIHSWFGEEGISLEGLSNLFQMYSLGFALIFLFFALMYFRAFKKQRSVPHGFLLFFYARHFAIYVLVALLSVGISALKFGMEIGLPGMIYFLLGPLCYFHAKHFESKYPIEL